MFSYQFVPLVKCFINVIRYWGALYACSQVYQIVGDISWQSITLQAKSLGALPREALTSAQLPLHVPSHRETNCSWHHFVLVSDPARAGCWQVSSVPSLSHSHLPLIKDTTAFYKPLFSRILNSTTLAFLPILQMELFWNQRRKEQGWCLLLLLRK